MAMYPERLAPLVKQMAWLMSRETGLHVDPEWVSIIKPEPISGVIMFAAQVDNTTILCYSRDGANFAVRTVEW